MHAGPLLRALLPLSAWTGQQQYDLGGACNDQPSRTNWKEIGDAESNGEWDRAVALRKEAVRSACGIEYVWYGLINALLKAHRPTEAVSVSASDAVPRF